MRKHTRYRRFAVTPRHAYHQREIFGNRFKQFRAGDNIQFFASGVSKFDVVFFYRVGIHRDVRPRDIFFAMPYRDVYAHGDEFVDIFGSADVAAVDVEPHTRHIFCHAGHTYPADSDEMHSQSHRCVKPTSYYMPECD